MSNQADEVLKSNFRMRCTQEFHDILSFLTKQEFPQMRISNSEYVRMLVYNRYEQIKSQQEQLQNASWIISTP